MTNFLNFFSRGGRRTDHQRALDGVFTPIAIGQILASTESLALTKIYNHDGYLRGFSVRETTPGTIKNRLCRILDHPLAPRVLATATLGASIALLAARGSRKTQIVASAVIGVCNRLNEVRTPYGRDGADQMTAVICQYRAISGLIPGQATSDDIFLRAVNFQAGLSYVASGFSKAFGSSWVQGDALMEILHTENYGSGPAAKVLRNRPAISRVLTIFTVFWETLFPVVYLLPARWGQYVLLAVKSFHLGVAATMELPRFVWGFLGSHGAISYVLRQNPRNGVLEALALGVAGLVWTISSVQARDSRKADLYRRLGPKGTRQLSVDGGTIEYQIDQPVDEPKSSKPIYLLESGLGHPLEAWTWLAGQLSQDHVVIRYHRRGYGLSDAPWDSDRYISELLNLAGDSAPIVIVTHSMGSLHAARYVNHPDIRHRVKQLIIIDGTDPDLLEVERTHRKTAGKFIQSQLNTLFAAVTGIFAWAPNVVERQAAYTPDDQFGYVQFIFTPGNIVQAVREYFSVPTRGSNHTLGQVSSRFLISSAEYEDQQAELANKLRAKYVKIPESSHRSILGYRKFALQVERAVRGAWHEI